jgi:UDP-N-acetylglucosamine 2-epimerase (non-hydrolysing)
LLTPSRDADVTLRSEGEPPNEIVFVGNVMIDTLCHSLERARATHFRESLGVGRDAVVVTLHRPSNVDEPVRLRAIASALAIIAERRPVVFTVHPRTAARIASMGIDLGKVRQLAPIRYMEMLDLVEGAYAVVTDSGGLQEETTALGVPCLTVRENTERPVTITEGTNKLVPDPRALPDAVEHIERPSSPRRPEGWDGHAGDRVIEAIISFRR